MTEEFEREEFLLDEPEEETEEEMGDEDEGEDDDLGDISGDEEV